MNERNKEIINLYLSGLSAFKISSLLNVSPAWIYKILKNNNIIRRTTSAALLTIDDQQVLNLYKAGNHPAKIGKILNKKITTITNSLKRTIKYKFNPIKYNINWDYDRQFELYLIGWLLSDGCLHIRRSTPKSRAKGVTINLALHKKDKLILEFIRNKISPSRPLHFDNNCCILSIPIDKDRVRYFQDFGVVERKSLILRATQKLIELSDTDFIQLLVGFIEGDGSIMIKYPKSPTNHKRYRMTQIAISSTYEFLRWIKIKLIDILGVDLGSVSKKKNTRIYDFRISGKKADQLIMICKQSKYCLMDRKWGKGLA